jgi:hypothetical protein
MSALESFNRRERQILVGWVLDRISFPLGFEFRQALSSVLNVSVPADAYVAMDYNLNWLTAAILWSQDGFDRNKPRSLEECEALDLNDNSDTDVLVAFAYGGDTHVVLLEAKGYTSWGTRQLKHKRDRLVSLFGEDGSSCEKIEPHWVFVSPSAPPKIDWAHWMVKDGFDSPPHLPLPQPASHKFAVGRCDAEGRKVDGGHWIIRPDKWPAR